jgi:hypothetical protein
MLQVAGLICAANLINDFNIIESDVAKECNMSSHAIAKAKDKILAAIQLAMKSKCTTQGF